MESNIFKCELLFNTSLLLSDFVPAVCIPQSWVLYPKDGEDGFITPVQTCMKFNGNILEFSSCGIQLKQLKILILVYTVPVQLHRVLQCWFLQQKQFRPMGQIETFSWNDLCYYLLRFSEILQKNKKTNHAISTRWRCWVFLPKFLYFKWIINHYSIRLWQLLIFCEQSSAWVYNIH